MIATPEVIVTPIFDNANLRDLLNDEIVLIGGGEVVIIGI